MKKIIILLVISALVITAVVLFSNGSLQTQLLNDQGQTSTTSQEETRTIEDCKKMSERLASDCIREIALREKDASYCQEITRRFDQSRCQREVEFQE